MVISLSMFYIVLMFLKIRCYIQEIIITTFELIYSFFIVLIIFKKFNDF